jgi:hypothetical protein
MFFSTSNTLVVFKSKSKDNSINCQEMEKPELPVAIASSIDDLVLRRIQSEAYKKWHQNDGGNTEGVLRSPIKPIPRPPTPPSRPRQTKAANVFHDVLDDCGWLEENDPPAPERRKKVVKTTSQSSKSPTRRKKLVPSMESCSKSPSPRTAQRRESPPVAPEAGKAPLPDSLSSVSISSRRPHRVRRDVSEKCHSKEGSSRRRGNKGTGLAAASCH